MPAKKIALGLGTYGRGFTLKNAASNGLSAPVSGGCNKGKYTGEKGFLAYFEICSMKGLKVSGVFITLHVPVDLCCFRNIEPR